MVRAFSRRSGRTPDAAFEHPIPGAHSIWELTLHLAATYVLVLRRLDGDGSQLTNDEDWPSTPDPTAANWETAVESLRALNQRVRQAVLRFNPERLDQPLVIEPYAAYTQFIGITQHNLYHAGQIVLLTRALALPR